VEIDDDDAWRAASLSVREASGIGLTWVVVGGIMTRILFAAAYRRLIGTRRRRLAGAGVDRERRGGCATTSAPYTNGQITHRGGSSIVVA
jgi:hypothetical protein